MRKTSRSRAADRGAAAVEMALVTLFLLVPILSGIVTYGLIFMAQISLNSGARDAARAGVVQPAVGTALTCSSIATLARNNTGTLGMDSSKVSVSVKGPAGWCNLPSVAGDSPSATLCTGASSGQITVSLSYTANSPFPLVPPKSQPLTSIGKFQCEYS
ncbi:MAG: TadE/TadG family type IV pilus assembly protein [Mycobacteriaceae bacterium]